MIKVAFTYKYIKIIFFKKNIFDIEQFINTKKNQIWKWIEFKMDWTVLVVNLLFLLLKNASLRGYRHVSTSPFLWKPSHHVSTFLQSSRFVAKNFHQKHETTRRRRNTEEGRWWWWWRLQWDEVQKNQNPFILGPIFSDAKWK